MRFIIDENTLWESTGRIAYRSSSHRGRDYIEVEFKEFYRHKPGSKIVYGRPFHLDTMPVEMRAFAEILAKAQKMLAAQYTNKSIKTRPTDDEEFDVYWDGVDQQCSLPFLHGELDQLYPGWYCKSESSEKIKKFVYYLDGQIVCIAKREL